MTSHESPIEAWPTLANRLGVELLVKRDDLLPFPLAGNKVRKVSAELSELAPLAGDVLITNGGVDSNYCRTVAFSAVRRGVSVHLVLHDDRDENSGSPSFRIYEDLGAVYEVMPSEEILGRIKVLRGAYGERGRRVHVLSGGGHSPAGTRAYLQAATSVLEQLPRLDYIVVASGTGATHAGIHVAASPRVKVIGVSVARSCSRGLASVAEAATWVGFNGEPPVTFDDRFTDGGYALNSSATRDTVKWAWRHGLPLDTVYTGKAFRGLVTLVGEGSIPQGARVLFWHTGGLFNYLARVLGDRNESG